MKFALFFAGEHFLAPSAHSLGGHNHGLTEEIIILGSNKNGIEINFCGDKLCGCCKKWGTQMVEGGYKVVDNVSNDINDLKVSEGLSSSSASCHTAFVDGVSFEFP